jgi:hypothetical protein
MRLTRLVHRPIAIIASKAPPEATIVRPCLRISFDLCESSANGTAIRFRSSSDIWSLSSSRSDREFSSIPRKAHSIYQSAPTRRTMREKKSIHSSSEGTPGLASLASGVGSGFCRSRESSIPSPDSASSSSGSEGSAANGLGNSSVSETMTIGSVICWLASASAASAVSPLFGGLILPTIGGIRYHDFRRFFGCWLWF